MEENTRNLPRGVHSSEAGDSGSTLRYGLVGHAGMTVKKTLITYRAEVRYGLDVPYATVLMKTVFYLKDRADTLRDR